MNDRVAPKRATIVWMGLVLATCITWWLGTDHPFASVYVRLAAALAIAIAFVKAYFIGADFMELRSAPKSLRVVFAAWIVGIGGATVVLSLI